MASKKTLNVRNLEALGAGRLAELLMEISTGDANAKRRLRLELVGAQSTGELVREVRKRLITIDRSRSFVDWQGVRALARDLDIQRRAIAETVAKADPKEALDLLWRFMALAPSIHQRCDESNEVVSDVFQEACNDIGAVALKAGTDPGALAEQAFDALCGNRYGEFNDLIPILTPALGQPGLEHLKQRMIAYRPVKELVTESRRGRTVRLALMEIAEAQGDVDAYLGQYDDEARKDSRIAADIARRLLAAGRKKEAWRAIEAAVHRERSGWIRAGFEWENARIEVLEALGRTDDAQATRWDCFDRSFSATHLRAYLKQLPDFDDVEAEERALDHVQGSKNFDKALNFLVSWPAPERAANLLIQRTREIDGNGYHLLTAAAGALAGTHPLAATLALRAMIDFSLTTGRSKRYEYAARHFVACAGLSSAIDDFGSFETHDAYEARLRREHGRKYSFWNFVRSGA